MTWLLKAKTIDLKAKTNTFMRQDLDFDDLEDVKDNALNDEEHPFESKDISL